MEETKAINMFIIYIYIYILGCPPPSNSHHQNDITFLVGDLNLNLHLPQASWEGGQPNIYICSIFASLHVMKVLVLRIYRFLNRFILSMVVSGSSKRW